MKRNKNHFFFVTCTGSPFLRLYHSEIHRAQLSESSQRCSLLCGKKIFSVSYKKVHSKDLGMENKQPQKYGAREKASSCHMMCQLDFQILPMMIGLRVR